MNTWVKPCSFPSDLASMVRRRSTFNVPTFNGYHQPMKSCAYNATSPLFTALGSPSSHVSLFTFHGCCLSTLGTRRSVSPSSVSCQRSAICIPQSAIRHSKFAMFFLLPSAFCLVVASRRSVSPRPRVPASPSPVPRLLSTVSHSQSAIRHSKFAMFFLLPTAY